MIYYIQELSIRFNNLKKALLSTVQDENVIIIIIIKEISVVIAILQWDVLHQFTTALINFSFISFQSNNFFNFPTT